MTDHTDAKEQRPTPWRVDLVVHSGEDKLDPYNYIWILDVNDKYVFCIQYYDIDNNEENARSLAHLIVCAVNACADLPVIKDKDTCPECGDEWCWHDRETACKCYDGFYAKMEKLINKYREGAGKPRPDEEDADGD